MSASGRSVPIKSAVPYGDFLVFVDESGDHGLVQCDPTYPVFVLAFCIVKKEDYASVLCPALARFKFRHFGHDAVVLHEREINKGTGPFLFLSNEARRDAFMDDLTGLMHQAPFALVAVVIQKERLKAQYHFPANPYHLALEFGLERVARYLEEQGQAGRLTPLVCEARGRREDDALELEFHRVAATVEGFEIHFVDKKANLPGLQIADLVARPIGRKVLKPEQPNRAYSVLESKFRRGPGGLVLGYGLKVFPA